MSKSVDSGGVSESALWTTATEYFHNIHAPAFGKVSHASDLTASPGGRYLAFTGEVLEKVESNPPSNIYLFDLFTKTLQGITSGRHHDRQPLFSPDGQYISFLSDRAGDGISQLYVVTFVEGSVGPLQLLSTISGNVEYHFWSPDSSRILLGVAGIGAEKQSASGSGNFKTDGVAPPILWKPEIYAGPQDNEWRSLTIYDLRTRDTSRVSPVELNVWDGNWCGGDSLIAVVSDRPSEGAWYHARLVRITIATGQLHTILSPISDFQFSRPISTASGDHSATIRALCSDRSIVAGNIQLIDMRDHSVSELTTHDVDVTEVSWIDETTIFFSGLRRSKTVYGQVNIATQEVTEILEMTLASGKWLPEATAINSGRFAVFFEGWNTYQELRIVQKDHEETLLSLSHDGSTWLQGQIGSLRDISWKSHDGTEIQGFLATPAIGLPPFPLIVDVHGGPVWAWQNRWPGIEASAFYVSRGYAVLFPNPRGSVGRGQDFIRAVYGDMGGDDHRDILSGIDHLVSEGIVDQAKVGVTGRSYGGTMSTWIITQSNRFAASVPIAAGCDWRSQHTTSNIPEFDQIFLQSDPYEVGNEYETRSSLLYAGRHPTPVLQVVGREDHCVPWTQGLQYHSALLEKGVESVLAVYPGEAHGVRKFPAYVDFCVRTVEWFDRFMAPSITNPAVKAVA